MVYSEHAGRSPYMRMYRDQLTVLSLFTRRDGTERVDVPDNATVDELKRKISIDLSIPLEQITLSANQALVRIL
eukprot:9487311-Pyramimonas_sp.AAC.1